MREEKSSSAYKDLEIELSNVNTNKKKILNEKTDTQPLNFFRDEGLNMLGNVATTSNKLVTICTVRDMLASVRDNY